MATTTLQPELHKARARDRGRDVLLYLGELGELGAASARAAFRRPFPWAEVITQVEVIGIASLSIVALTAIFSSLVMTVQFSVQLARFGAKAYVANVVSLSLVRELGPVLTALVVGGRVGAGIAAEIGSMVVTEQVDAMRAMGADPARELVLPRVAAAVVVLPLLTMFADVLGVLGAMVISNVTGDVNPTYFLGAVFRAVDLTDLAGGLVKTVFFGLFISLVASLQGLRATDGTQGVGRATTQAVVITSIITLTSDFVLTTILLQFGL